MTKDLITKWPVFERLTTIGSSFFRNLLLRKGRHVNKRKSWEFQEHDSLEIGEQGKQ